LTPKSAIGQHKNSQRARFLKFNEASKLKTWQKTDSGHLT
jgi:hypothetical protein